jgi:hypothetical protein
MDAPELVALVCPKTKDLGWAFYLTPDTIAVGESLGLDVFKFYILGRGGVLGDVEPELVVSAFGYFSSALVAQMWNEGRAIYPARDGARAYWTCCADLGRARLTGMAGIEEFCRAAGDLNDAADPVGHPVYAGIKSLRLADDLPGRAMQLMVVLREFRRDHTKLKAAESLTDELLLAAYAVLDPAAGQALAAGVDAIAAALVDK